MDIRGRRNMSPMRRRRKVPMASCTRMSMFLETENTLVEQEIRIDEIDSLSCHSLTESLLTSGSGFSNYQGIFNLSVVLLVLIHIQTSLENFSKYGLLVDPHQIVAHLLQDPYNFPALYLMIGMNLSVFPALYLEKLKTQSYSAETAGTVLQYIHLALLIAIPAAMIYYVKAITPVGSMLILLLSIILVFKLYSYYEVNRWYRTWHPRTSRGSLKKLGTDPPSRHNKRCDRGQKQVMYPLNLTVPDFCYFIVAPTLCYQLNFPRNKRIRKRFLFWRLFEMVFLAQLMLGLVQQWIVPIILKSMKPINDIESSLLMEYLLKLAVPNHFVWLIFFYWFFHCCLNVIAELLCFGDREFYLDWWNTNNIIHFWSSWNRPLHMWLIRHVYKPMLLNGYEKLQAQTVIFLFYALIYESLISIPLKIFQFFDLFYCAGPGSNLLAD
ncbi:diacylglycerol O-acyltransferase 1-like [Rhinatrema bivittatum]|uniref:diacylglycerol O-acyltransferase 1-like n=1 Tax=Rhinatrema bivittatum TaxID=194408 RepID=UPI0011299BB8|nr:diacylglycerol O-acyltransferase 1-like [Rhinatrema bivittatum]XP_029440567.1 diacylglycerol O-acyltransferase 1-like [Rhinatrema bivittatum]